MKSHKYVIWPESLFKIFRNRLGNTNATEIFWLFKKIILIVFSWALNIFQNNREWSLRFMRDKQGKKKKKKKKKNGHWLFITWRHRTPWAGMWIGWLFRRDPRWKRDPRGSQDQGSGCSGASTHDRFEMPFELNISGEENTILNMFHEDHFLLLFQHCNVIGWGQIKVNSIQ